MCLAYALGVEPDALALDALRAAGAHAEQTVRLSSWYRVGDVLRTALVAVPPLDEEDPP